MHTQGGGGGGGGGENLLHNQIKRNKHNNKKKKGRGWHSLAFRYLAQIEIQTSLATKAVAAVKPWPTQLFVITIIHALE